MAELLKIYYDRVISSEEVTLTTSNCSQYGYSTTTHVDSALGTINVYYLTNDSPDNYVPYDENGVTTILYETRQRYTHIAPPCSNYNQSFADVDKEGSGRNELTGEMFRERIGSYSKVDITWDLIPNTTEYNNWYKVLTHLPPMVYADLLMPSGTIETKEFYRADISTNLYLFIDSENKQIWQGLSTSFIQWNIDEIDDTIEPTLESV